MIIYLEDAKEIFLKSGELTSKWVYNSTKIHEIFGYKSYKICVISVLQRYKKYKTLIENTEGSK